MWGRWLGVLLVATAVGSDVAAADVVARAGDGGALRRAPRSCGAGPTLVVDRGSPLDPSDDALLRVRGVGLESVVPALDPWRDPTLVCAGDAPWVWMWRDDGDEPSIGLFPVTDHGFGAGVFLDGLHVDPRPSPSGRFVVLREEGGEGGQTLVDLTTKKSRALPYGGEVTDGAWLSGDRLAVVVDNPAHGATLTVWDPIDGGAVRDLPLGARRPRPGTLSVSPDGRNAVVAMGADDPGLRVVDLRSGAVSKIHGPGVRVTWTASSRAFAAVGTRGGRRQVAVWRQGKVRWFALPKSGLGVTQGDESVSLAWLDASRLVVGSRAGLEPVRMLEKGRLRELRTPNLALDAVSRTADGDLWAVGRGELWRIPREGRVHKVDVSGEVEAVSVRDDDSLLVVGRDGRVERIPADHR